MKENENEKKRWSVTYTKHIKQKRKVYHDGFLDLNISSNKLMLLDESEKLLECRILKKDEAVSSAQTLSFDAYLVDVGALLLHLPSHLTSTSDATTKSNAMNLSLSPSQKIIREFKKSQVQKYGASQTGPNTTTTTTTTSFTEWQVTYTTQVTRKAKKYHDGFLQLTDSGELQRQIMLFDGTKKLINSRFLKKDELIQCGESIAFDAHLVDIGEAVGDHKASITLDVFVNNHNVARKTGLMHRVQNCLKINKSFLKGKPNRIACPKEYKDSSFSIANIDEKKLSQNISANKPLRDANQILSILQKPQKHDCIAIGSVDKNIMNPALPANYPHNSDCTRNVPKCGQLPRISIAHQETSGVVDYLGSSQCLGITDSSDQYSEGLESVSKSSCSGIKSSENIEPGNSHQPRLEKLEVCPKRSNEALEPGSLSPTGRSWLETVDLTKNTAENKISREAGGCPSFDLGFD